MRYTHDLITRHWALANARDWQAFAATLHPDIEYRVPQTRELIRGMTCSTRYLLLNKLLLRLINPLDQRLDSLARV